MGFDVPIAFCTFNRPRLTERVFQTIRQQRPKRLLLISDGPRNHVESDAGRVKACREIISQIDWNCDVQTNFSDTNLGCRIRMSSGLTWAFEQAEELIVLEDDCLPHESFFNYCRELLNRYRDDDRIKTIGSNNFQPGPRSSNSYYFSKYAHIWGWASWRSTWQNYDVELKSWTPQQGETFDFVSEDEKHHWCDAFDRVSRGEIDTWDFSLQHLVWAEDGLVALPERNLVTNLGFGNDATHTKQKDSPIAELPSFAMDEIIHPSEIRRNAEADKWTFQKIFHGSFDHAPAPVQPRKKPWFRRLFKAA